MGALFLIALTGIMLLLFSLVWASANQILRLPSFLQPTLTHPAALWGWEISGPWGWFGSSLTCCGGWKSRRFSRIRSAAARGRVAQRRPRLLPPAEWRSVWSGGWEARAPPRAAVTQGNGTSGETFRNKSGTRGSSYHAHWTWWLT